MEKKLYVYKGPVLNFGKGIREIWRAETYAESKKKAIANFKYQYKKQFNMPITSKIELPGKIVEGI